MYINDSGKLPFIASGSSIRLRLPVLLAFMLTACGGGASGNANVASVGTESSAGTNLQGSSSTGQTSGNTVPIQTDGNTVSDQTGPLPRTINTTAKFDFPNVIAADSDGNLYIAEYEHPFVIKLTSGGLATLLAGSSQKGTADGSALQAQFQDIKGIAANRNGEVFIIDASAVRKMSKDGLVTTIAGTAGETGFVDGVGPAARFSNPEGIAIDSAGNLIVADSGNNAIRKIALDGTVSTIVVGNGLRGPKAVAVDRSNTIFVMDISALWKIASDTPVLFAGWPDNVLGSNSVDGFGTDARFMPDDTLTIDAVTGTLYVTEGDTLGPCGGTHSVVRKITAAAVVTTIAGKPRDECNPPSGVDGTGINARFYTPHGIASGPDGNLYVADTGNNTIRQVTPDGVVITIAGKSAH